MINQKTDSFEGITLTVRARIGADVWDEFAVKAKLPKIVKLESNHVIFN